MTHSEFGKGLTYCLGLFLAHAERYSGIAKTEADFIDRPSMWFYAAADHIFDLEVPDFLSAGLKARLRKFKKKVMSWRMCMIKEDDATAKDKTWAIEEAKELLRLIDKSIGVKTSQGGYL